MDNSKYLALVDLMGKDGADRVRENAAEFLASLDCEFKPEIHQDCGDGLDAVRWAGGDTVTVSDPLPSWHDMPVLERIGTRRLDNGRWILDDSEDERTCPYCGKVNPASARACGEGKWDGCGAPLPRQEEPPRGVLHLQEPELEQFGSFYVVKETNHPAPEIISGEMPEPHISFYPEPEDIEVTIYHPGKMAGDFKNELGARLLSAFRKVMNQWA